ncbi:hypothetical protein F4802DRAFT_419779 [Xylaria palmicola]|nr:hypothetical protein F4802DRAFT_419779 [Xylaria palmicola]
MSKCAGSGCSIAAAVLSLLLLYRLLKANRWGWMGMGCGRGEGGFIKYRSYHGCLGGCVMASLTGQVVDGAGWWVVRVCGEAR